MEKEFGSSEELLDAARKQFLDGDLSNLDFEIEELENRLAFTVTTEGGSDGCYSDCGDCVEP